MSQFCHFLVTGDITIGLPPGVTNINEGDQEMICATITSGSTAGRTFVLDYVSVNGDAIGDYYYSYIECINQYKCPFAPHFLTNLLPRTLIAMLHLAILLLGTDPLILVFCKIRLVLITTFFPSTGGVDFTPASGSLTFNDGVGSSVCFTIQTTEDGSNEGLECFSINLSTTEMDPSLTIAPASTIVCIVDDVCKS